MPPRVRNARDLAPQKLPGRSMVELFSGSAIGSQQVTFRVVEIPRVRPPERRYPHEHISVEECIYVLSGRGRVWVAGESMPVETGDAVLIPPATLHATLSVSDEPLRLACFFPTADMPASLVEHPEVEIPEDIQYGDS